MVKEFVTRCEVNPIMKKDDISYVETVGKAWWIIGLADLRPVVWPLT